jgi:exosortase
MNKENSEQKTDRPWQEDLRKLTPEPTVLVALGCLAVAFVWFYWTSLRGLTLVTWMNADYQHGPFVPVFSLFLLWYRRDMIIPFKGKGSWWGLAFFALWALMRLTAVYFNFGSLPEESMIPFFAGLALFVGGWQALHWAWPSVVFLAFMLPLPGDIQSALSQQLQGIATRLSVYTIQTLGIPAVSSGNVIQLTDRPLEVEQACSGLRMMMMFFALSIGAAFIMKKPLWEKLLVIVSGAPIAIMANVARIVVTAVCFEIARHWPSLLSSENASKFIHDAAGLVIEAPCGVLLLILELTILSKLLLPPLEERPLMMSKLQAEQAPAGGERSVRDEKRV